jgi:5-methylcytosine-specific restriction endonuclease McrA
MPVKGTKEEIQAYHKNYYQRLKSGETTARGTKPPRNLLGIKFNNLVAIKFSHRQGFLQIPMWYFLCDCGKTKLLSARDVVPGKTKSCGCLPRGKKGTRIGLGEAAFNNLLCAYKGGAKSRSLEFSLTAKEFREITKKNCVYCGIEPVQIWKGTNRLCSEYTYNGVDRINNKQGYVLNNTVPCCKVCNKAKHNMELHDFIAWLDRIIKFRTRESDVN